MNEIEKLEREIENNRDFLNWKNLQNKSNKYIPQFHIYPTQGLLNDPNCTFFHDNKLYCFFQHHPGHVLHGLKTMSLATTTDFVNFDYSYMVNTPDDFFDSHGVYTGSSIIVNNKVHCFYTGNVRNEDWSISEYVVKCEYDLKTNKFINKKNLFSNLDYTNYTGHFRDPCIFEYKNKYYFILGAQRKDIIGTILLFELDNNLEKSKLIKEFELREDIRMIECPNIAFVQDKVYFIYCPEYNDQTLAKDSRLSPDVCWYSLIDLDKVLGSKEFKQKIDNHNIVDYGLEFYAPQVFKMNNESYIIGWSGIPSNVEYKEKEYGWLNMLTMFKKIELDDNNKLMFKEMDIYKQAYLNSNNKFVKYQQVWISDNQTIEILDKDLKVLSINQTNNELTIRRNNDESYFRYHSSVKIKAQANNQLDIFIDNSIIEIKINNKEWYTSRLYFDNEIVINKK